jgi:hypothetical protein
MRQRLFAFALLLIVFAAGCGGDGGSADVDAAVPEAQSNPILRANRQ